MFEDADVLFFVLLDFAGDSDETGLGRFLVVIVIVIMVVTVVVMVLMVVVLVTVIVVVLVMVLVTMVVLFVIVTVALLSDQIGIVRMVLMKRGRSLHVGIADRLRICQVISLGEVSLLNLLIILTHFSCVKVHL